MEAALACHDMKQLHFDAVINPLPYPMAQLALRCAATVSVRSSIDDIQLSQSVSGSWRNLRSDVVQHRSNSHCSVLHNCHRYSADTVCQWLPVL